MKNTGLEYVQSQRIACERALSSEFGEIALCIKRMQSRVEAGDPIDLGAFRSAVANTVELAARRNALLEVTPFLYGSQHP